MDFLLCLLTLLGSYIELPAYLKFARPRPVSTHVHGLTWVLDILQQGPLIPAKCPQALSSAWCACQCTSWVSLRTL